jgi:glycosyltransferase involved in cell wall biosynthesis
MVAVPDEGPLAAAAQKLNVATATLPSAQYANGHKNLSDVTRFAAESPRLAHAIHRLLRANDIDLLYVNAPRLLPPAALAARLRNVRLVFHSHNRLLQAVGIVVAGRALRLARARVIACCQFAAEPIRPYVESTHLSIVYNGVELIRAEESRARERITRIGVIGRVEPEKGQMEFVEAARKVVKRYPHCQFLIVGAPLFSNSSYLERVTQRSLGLPLEFLGWRDDIRKVLSELDLLVVPSSPADSTPRVIFEAFAARVPVVVFPSGGIPEIVQDQCTGFLTSRAEADALGERICSVIEMEHSQIEGVVSRARAAWEQNYTVEIYRNRVSQFLQHAV